MKYKRSAYTCAAVILNLFYILLYSPPAQAQTSIQGDLNKDGKVDIYDYNILVTNYGNTACGNVADINLNCKVDIFDYNILITNYGAKITTPSPTPAVTTTPTTIVGYGKNTVGGTGGTLTNVSSLSALKACIAASGKRICKITGSGVWDGNGQLMEVANPNITIDGEGSGVIFKDTWLHVKTSQVILRHLRMRTGDLNVNAQDADAISINGSGGTISNIVVDHVEAIWGPDVCFTILNNVTDITVQYSIIGWGLTKSAHPEANDADGHNLAFNISGLSSTQWPKRVTVYKNLIGGAQGRYTRAMGAEATDIINNIYYNFDESPQGNPHSLNFVGNLLKWGPAPAAAGLAPAQNFAYRASTSGDFPNQFSNTIYEANNVCMNFSGCGRDGPASAYRTSPATTYSVTPATANTALFDSILSTVGPHPLDATSNRWINEAKNGTGTYFNGAGYPAPNPYW